MTDIDPATLQEASIMSEQVEYTTIRRQSEQMLARTDTLLTMALSLLETASADLATGWHHVVAGEIEQAASKIRVQRAIIRSRLAED